MRLLIFTLCFLVACSKSDSPGTTPEPPPPAGPFNFKSTVVDGKAGTNDFTDVSRQPSIRINFTAGIEKTNIENRISLTDINNTAVPLNITFANNDSAVVVTPSSPVNFLNRYLLKVSPDLVSKANRRLAVPLNIKLLTKIDSSYKFSEISDDELLTLTQRQHFKYFWDFGHPISGLARERNSSGDLVTSGGSGFGVLAIITGIHRGFITRTEGRERLQKMVSFLRNNADHFHGAFPHWMNGITGKTIPFSANDNGADLVETSYLIQGLITARQYFDQNTTEEQTLREGINFLWNRVEWDFFRKNNENVLYWHWSPDKAWAMNLPIRGWNESLITYVMAASSTTHTIPKEVYDEGWTRNGGMKNGNVYYGHKLPLGPAYGGPLFLSHYSFLTIDPRNLTDQYANYMEQNTAHAKIHHQYSIANPGKFFGYSDSVWGLTASDDPFVGYKAHEPGANDNGVVSPTAALSSFPYTPVESMKALKFFYYVLGDKLWKNYGFIDAFSLNEPWFADSFLAIDQGPIIIMIENHRSQLLWNLFMSAPEIKAGMTKLGFQSPKL